MSFQDGVTVITAEWLNGVDTDIASLEGETTSLDSLKYDKVGGTISGGVVVDGSINAYNYNMNQDLATYGNYTEAAMIVGADGYSSLDNAISFRTNNTERVLIEKGGDIGIFGNIDHSGGSADRWDIYQNTGSTDGPGIQMSGTGHADEGRVKVVGCSLGNTDSSVVPFQILNYNGSGFDTLFDLAEDGSCAISYKFTVAKIGATSNEAQVVSTRYLKEMVDYTARGSVVVTALSTYTFAAGIWSITTPTTSIYLEINEGTGWQRDASPYSGGTIVCDGTNVRVYNSSASDRSFKFLKQGLQR